MSTFSVVVLIIGIALIFDFINGFHDAANSIATIVATRVLTPLQAVAWAAFFNFVAAFMFGTGVSVTVGKWVAAIVTVSPFQFFAWMEGLICWGRFTSCVWASLSVF